MSLGVSRAMTEPLEWFVISGLENSLGYSKVGALRTRGRPVQRQVCKREVTAGSRVQKGTFRLQKH